MKLRNKKTGEIKEIIEILVDDKSAIRTVRDINSLTELNEVWEDVPEEPKEYWIPMSDEPYPFVGNDWEKEGLATGLISLSKEENEIKREKLKAWKRLEDRHFKFDDYDILNQTATWLVSREYGQYENDIKLLFGGEK